LNFLGIFLVVKVIIIRSQSFKVQIHNVHNEVKILMRFKLIKIRNFLVSLKIDDIKSGD